MSSETMTASSRAVQAAEVHARAAEQIAAFIEAVAQEPDPTMVAEYAGLLRREEAARKAREEAIRELGLSVPSEGVGDTSP